MRPSSSFVLYSSDTDSAKAIMFKTALLLISLLTAVSGQIIINPVVFNQCETANISWSGGTGESMTI